MDKDLKIAIVIISIIILIALFEDSGPIGTSHSVMPVISSQQKSKKTSTQTNNQSRQKSCYHNGIELKGKVQFVDSFPDLKVKYVSSFADIHVEFVSSFPDDCGQWQEVSSFPDFKVQVVDSFPDIEVKKVSSFPGMQ